MKKSARNSLLAGAGLVAVGSIIVAQKRRRSTQDETTGYPDYTASMTSETPQGGAGDDQPIAFGRAPEAQNMEEVQSAEELGKIIDE